MLRWLLDLLHDTPSTKEPNREMRRALEAAEWHSQRAEIERIANRLRLLAPDARTAVLDSLTESQARKVRKALR